MTIKERAAAIGRASLSVNANYGESLLCGCFATLTQRK